ncbi:hypothetical protein [Larkinella rosea]|uniref:Uncharacterized protein n=1 Tax=Larkinella rosea TaxID=2025312 RepID=A0A3P1C0B7_9BACT|nr:hypothetical protein [Larkinella rosea]RRB06850.1 hypothetical protein EHT25_03415 [Larkinella rosea]
MTKNTPSVKRIQESSKLVNIAPDEQVVVKDSYAHGTASLKIEQQLNVWIPKDLMKRLKVKGAETDRSLKEMVIDALEKIV